MPSQLGPPPAFSSRPPRQAQLAAPPAHPPSPPATPPAHLFLLLQRVQHLAPLAMLYDGARGADRGALQVRNRREEGEEREGEERRRRDAWSGGGERDLSAAEHPRVQEPTSKQTNGHAEQSRAATRLAALDALAAASTKAPLSKGMGTQSAAHTWPHSMHLLASSISSSRTPGCAWRERCSMPSTFMFCCEEREGRERGQRAASGQQAGTGRPAGSARAQAPGSGRGEQRTEAQREHTEQAARLHGVAHRHAAAALDALLQVQREGGGGGVVVGLEVGLGGSSG